MKYRAGFARPGALLLTLAIGLAVLGGAGPLFYAAAHPNHEFFYIATGPQALLLGSWGFICSIMYAVGVFLYSGSKGYNWLVSLILLVANVPGFLLMLVLPDRTLPSRSGSATPMDTVRR
jgi:hypothetical protein